MEVCNKKEKEMKIFRPDLTQPRGEEMQLKLTNTIYFRQTKSEGSLG
jgi:hypothetical protein